MERGALLERDTELRTLTEAVASARAGIGSLVTISAHAGMGKTRLTEAAAALAAESGVQPLVARGSELQRAVPYAVARELLESALRRRGARERSRLLAGGAASAAALLDRGHEAPHTTPDAGETLLGLYWLIANLADTGALALLVDDLQWADPRSVDLLEFLVPRLSALPVALVAAARPPADDADDPCARLHAGAPDGRRIALEPLSPQATRQVLRAAVGRAVAPEFAEACRAATGGNPFYLGELAHELVAHAIAPTADGAAQVHALGPGTVARATLVRLHRVSPEALTVARSLAILGDGASPADVAAHTGLDHDDVAAATAALVREAVLADVRPARFAHPIVRAAIRGDLPAVERASLHAHAAAVLHDRGAPAEQIATHLLEAEPGTTSPWAAGVLRAAAAAAREHGAPSAAAALLRRLVAEPAVEDAWEVRTELGANAFDAGEPDALEHLRAAHADAPTAEARASVALAMALPLTSAGGIPEAVATLRDALAETSDEELAEELRAQLSALAPLDPAVTAEVMRELEPRADIEPATPAARRTLANLAQWMAMRGAPADRVAELSLRALDRGRLLAEAGPNAPSFLYATFLLIAADRFDAARAELTGALDLAQRRGSVSGFMWATMIRSLLAYREGALEESVADAQLATDVAGEHGWGAGLPATVGFLVDALIEQGRLEEAQAALARGGGDDDVPDTLLTQALLVARGRLATARGDLRSAVRHLEELQRQTTGEGWSGIVGTPTFRTYLAPALAALGERERAQALADEEVALAKTWGAPRAVGTALRVHGVVAGRDGGAATLAEAVSVLATTGARLEHARALADLGAALRRDGQASASRDPLREAIDLAHRCGAAPLVAYAQDELAATGARRTNRLMLTGVASLTPSERRIAGMAAAGQSNGEIAQALFLTRKTIEMHLGHAYRKLGIRSRAELPTALEHSEAQGGTP